ncbi:MAG: MCE family protein [Myxococcales bacterium]|nr:MCE family protein [Myxococcales bacterium]
MEVAPTSRSRRRLVLIGVVSLLTACSKFGRDPGPPDFAGVPLVVALNDRAGIEVGDPVFVKGFEVGKVSEVVLAREVEVTLSVIESHLDSLTVDTYAKVTAPGILESGRIELVVVDPEGPALAPGSRIAGATTTTERVALESKIRLRRALDAAKAEGGIGGFAREAGAAARDQLQDALGEFPNLDETRQGLREKTEAATDSVKARLSSARDELADAAGRAKTMASEAGAAGLKLAGELTDDGAALLGAGKEKVGAWASRAAEAVKSVPVGEAVDALEAGARRLLGRDDAPP